MFCSYLIEMISHIVLQLNKNLLHIKICKTRIHLITFVYFLILVVIRLLDVRIRLRTNIVHIREVCGKH